MKFHIILTELCNSKCKYCYEKSMNEFDNGLDKKWKFDFSAPTSLDVNLESLKKFILSDQDLDNTGTWIIFYGGEPLLELDKIKDIIDLFQGEKKKIQFGMQTNGKLLNQLPKEYLNKFSKILVSLDGGKNRTDYNKGPNTYRLVINNLKKIRENGFTGEIVARMAIPPWAPDIYDQILELLKLVDEKLIDSIHWQLDAGFYKNDFNKKEFEEFTKIYNQGITELVNYWLKTMKEEGKVLKLYPFLGVFNNLYYNQPTKLMCGAGYANYTITTDGKIVACPIMNNILDFYCGNINDNTPQTLQKFDISEPCTYCNVKDICGGRCLYSNHAKLWPKEGEELICKTIKHLITEIKRVLPEIKELINSGKINEEDFRYEKYFGPEIIP